MEYMDSSLMDTAQLPMVLCCQCGAAIQPNPTNTCVACLQTQVDIADEIPKQCSLQFCRNCERYLQPPATWLTARLESRELLSVCLKALRGLNKVHLVDAGFVWTEPHSKRIKVKLVIQKEIRMGAILQQSFVVDYVIQSQMCTDCHRVEAKDIWKGVVQVRQKVQHRKSFYYLEQVILKYRAHAACCNIKEESGGLDFFFAREQDARKFADFVTQIVPCRLTKSKKLKSHDTHDNTYNYKYSYAIEIVPTCKDNVVCLPKHVAKSLGNLGQLCVCLRVSNLVTLIDPQTLQTADVSAQVFWREPFTAICDSLSQLTQFVVIDIEPINEAERYHKSGEGSVSHKHTLADVYVSRLSELGAQQIHTRSHLGALLKPGDLVLGYDFANSNVNHTMLNSMREDSIPDVILIKKVYSDRARRNRRRRWHLQRLAASDAKRAAVGDCEDYVGFMEDLEEDPVFRKNVNIYRGRNNRDGHDSVSTTTAGGDDEELPGISVEEMLEDFHIDTNESFATAESSGAFAACSTGPYSEEPEMDDGD